MIDEALRRTGAVPPHGHASDVVGALCLALRHRRPAEFQRLLDTTTGAISQVLNESPERRLALDDLRSVAEQIAEITQLAGSAVGPLMVDVGKRLELDACFQLLDDLLVVLADSCPGDFRTVADLVASSSIDVIRTRHRVLECVVPIVRGSFVTGSRAQAAELLLNHGESSIDLPLVVLGQTPNIFTLCDDAVERLARAVSRDAGDYFRARPIDTANLYFFRSFLRLLSALEDDVGVDEAGESFWNSSVARSSPDAPVLTVLATSPRHAGRVLATWERLVAEHEADIKPNAVSVSIALASMHIDHGRFAAARSVLRELHRLDDLSVAAKCGVAQQFVRLGEVDRARTLIDAAVREATDAFETRIDGGHLRELEQAEDLDLVVGFYETTARLDARVTAAGESWWHAGGPEDRQEAVSLHRNHVVVVGDLEGCLNTVGLSTFPLGLLQAAGASSMALTTMRLGRGGLQVARRLDLTAAANEGADLHPRSLYYTWRFDPDSRYIGTLGLNFYQSIFERIARSFRRFNVDMHSPYARRLTRVLACRCDRVLRFLELLRLAATAAGKRVTLVAVQPQFAPWSVLRDYAGKHPETFTFVHLTSAYQNWLENRVDGEASSIAMANLTRHPTTRTATLGVAAEFEKFIQQEFVPDRALYEARIEAALRRDRTRRKSEAEEEPSATSRWREAVRAARSAGRTVYCALGKIPYDLAVPTMGGPAHSDIADWLCHTIETVSSTPHLLLIKPHPHERAFSISQAPTETFADLAASADAGDNVMWLDHHDASLQELVEHVDLFLIWNGTSILEVGALGAPVVACDAWAARDYPVGATVPPNRPTYEEWLCDPGSIPIDPAFPTRCRAGVAYLGSDWIAVDHPWFGRSSSNLRFHRPWYTDKAERPSYDSAGRRSAVRHALLAFGEPPLDSSELTDSCPR